MFKKNNSTRVITLALLSAFSVFLGCSSSGPSESELAGGACAGSCSPYHVDDHCKDFAGSCCGCRNTGQFDGLLRFLAPGQCDSGTVYNTCADF